MVALSSIEPRIAALPDGGQVSYLEAGRGTPLVLLHGIGSAARSWRVQLTGLSDRFRVIAWDAPGYGESSQLDAEIPDAGDYAARLEEFVAALGLGRFHLAGHSLGCLMAARFAALHPARLRSLTLSAVAIGHADKPEEERRQLLQSRLDDVAGLGARGMAEKRGPRLVGPVAAEDVKRAVIDTMAAIRPAGYVQAARMLSAGNAIADIARLPDGMPVQFIYGTADVITTPASNRQAAAARPGAPVHVIKDTGHALYLERPDSFNRILADFLEAHDDPA